MTSGKNNPQALLVFPPVYDFALYDLYIKPFSLIEIGKQLKGYGFDVTLLNCLDYSDPFSIMNRGKPKRKKDGTGKFFKQRMEKPPALKASQRSYSRYGVAGEVIEKKIGMQVPDVVLISSGMSYWYPGIREVVDIVRKKHPRVPIVIGGIYATLCTDHCRKITGVDHVISGDAFPRLDEILASLRLPSRTILKTADYSELLESYKEAGIIRLNKGCPFSCRYCASRIVCGKFIPGNADDGLSELSRLHRLWGTACYAFYDDALLISKETVFLPFLEGVARKNLELRFYLPNGIHVSCLDDRTAQLMKKTGFREIRLGFESASEDFHAVMDRKLDLKMFEEGLRMLKLASFSSNEMAVYILAGMPGQHREEVEESIRYVSGLNVKPYVAEYSPVPGTGLWAESVRLSRYPLEEEPLTHNNSLFPLEWEKFSLKDLSGVKTLAAECRHRISH
ncbi:MAG: radical SAM protein [Spirochaetales bacterium]|nr:radical SAM protein [Spirochaetales bacterium]